MTRPTRQAFGAWAVLTALILLASGGPAAWAHTSLISSLPQDGAVLLSAPSEVALTFDEDLLPGTNVIAVTDANGKVIVTQPAQPEGSTIRLPWPAGLPAGEYQIGYRVVSADGHPVNGAILITINGPTGGASPSSSPAPSTPAPAAGAAQVPEDSSDLPVLALSLGALAVIAVAVGAAVAVVRRRRRR